jgi:hypothetical protein
MRPSMNDDKITRKDIIKVFFKGIDLSSFSDTDIDQKIEELRNIVEIWEKNKYKLGEK